MSEKFEPFGKIHRLSPALRHNREAGRHERPAVHPGGPGGADPQRGYGLAEKRFSLFNTGRWDDDNTPDCVSVVPVLFEGVFSSDEVDIALNRLAVCGSVAAPGFPNPEGVVVFMAAANSLFKVTLGGDGHKGVRQ